jgi:molecular chaperone DnaK
VAAEAERAKIALSERAEARLQVPFVAMVNQQQVDLDVTLTRAQLEKLTRPLVDRSMAVCLEVLRARGLRADQIDEIVIVGGQSQAPLVQDRITVMFGRKPVTDVRPEEAVALGAALLAASLERQSGLLLIDVLPASIGVGVPGGRFHPVIAKNAPLPVRKSFRVATTRDDQRSIEVTIFQGEAPRARDNTLLGTFVVPDLPRGPRGSAAVSLSFELSNEGLLTLQATEEGSGREVVSRFATKDTPAAVKARLAALERAPVPGADGAGVLGWMRRVLGGK